MISCRRHEGVFKPREAGTIFSVYIYIYMIYTVMYVVGPFGGLNHLETI